MNSENPSVTWPPPTEWVIERLTRETYRSMRECTFEAQIFLRLHPDVQGDLLNWWQHQLVTPDKEICGWSIRRLFDKGVCIHVCDCFTWLSGFLTDPKDAALIIQASRAITPHATHYSIGGVFCANRVLDELEPYCGGKRV